MKFTRKLCPGCGRTEIYPFRETDRVCKNCQRLINEALEHRKTLDNITDRMRIQVGKAYHWNKGYYEGDLHRNLKTKLLKIMVKLIKEVSEKNYGVCAWKDPIILRDLGGKPDGDEGESRYIGKRLFGLLRGLDRLIRLALRQAHHNGKREGSSLIVMLASGQITLDKFQKSVDRR